MAGTRRWWVLVACITATVANNIQPPASVFRPPEIQAFNAGWAAYSFWSSVAALGALAFLLIGGVLGDLFGRRRVMLIGIGGLIAGNLLVLFSPSIAWFVVSRFAAGAAGTLVLPLSLSMLYLAFDDDEKARARAIAIYVLFSIGAALFAGLLGQLMQGLLAWRATFAVPTLLGIAALALVARETRESRVPDGRHFDVVGHAAWALTVFCAMFSLVVWLSQGPNAGWVLAGALAGVAVGLALLVWWDRQSRDSILRRSNIKRRVLVVLIVYGLCLQFGNLALVNQVRNVLQAVYGYGPVLATVALAPYGVGMLAMVLYASRRLKDAELRPLLALSLLIGAIVCVLVAVTRAAGLYPWLALLLLVFGATMVLANTVFTFIFFISVPSDALGVRTGISSSVGQLGGSLGGSVSAGLLVTYGLATYERLLAAAGVPPERADEAVGALNSLLNPATPGAVADPAIGERLLAGYQLAYLASFERVMLIVAAVCAAGALVAWLGLPRPRPAARPVPVAD